MRENKAGLLRRSCLYIVMLGAPGSGKGTQAYQLSQKYKIPHISSGDLLRNNPNLPKEVKKVMESGGFLSDEMIIGIVESKINEPASKKGWILDGFPRTLNQAKALESLSPSPPLVVYLKVDDEEIKKRLSLRRTCSSCGAIFHLVTHPPKVVDCCDLCEGKLIQRKDDSPDVVETRLKIYRQHTEPLIDFYRKIGSLVEIDSHGNQTVDQIFDRIVHGLERLAQI